MAIHEHNHKELHEIEQYQRKPGQVPQKNGDRYQQQLAQNSQENQSPDPVLLRLSHVKFLSQNTESTDELIMLFLGVYSAD